MWAAEIGIGRDAQLAGCKDRAAAVGVRPGEHQRAEAELAQAGAAADGLAGREDVGRALDVEAAVEGGPVHRGMVVDRGQGVAGYLQHAAGEGDRGRRAAQVGVGRDAQLARREDRAAEAVRCR